MVDFGGDTSIFHEGETAINDKVMKFRFLLGSGCLGKRLFLIFHSFLLAFPSSFHQQRHQSLLPSQAISVVCIYVYWDGVTDFIVSHKEYLTLKSSISSPWVEAKNQEEGR